MDQSNLTLNSTSDKEFNLIFKSYQCKICGSSFGCNFSLYIHERMHNDKLWKNKSYIASIVEKRRTTIHKSKKACDCEACYKFFFEINEYVRYKNMPQAVIPHKSYGPASKRRSSVIHEKFQTEKKRHKCKTCCLSFPNKIRLSIHEKTHRCKESSECENFDETSSQKSSSSTSKGANLGVRRYKCQICDLTFPYKISLNLHKKVHDDDEIFNRLLNQTRNLTTSEETDAQDQPQVNESQVMSSTVQEDILANQTRNLTTNEEIDAQDQPQVNESQVMSSTVQEDSPAKVQQSILTDEKSYKCRTCDLTFQFKTDLQDHKKSHTDKKPGESENFYASLSE